MPVKRSYSIWWFSSTGSISLRPGTAKVFLGTSFSWAGRMVAVRRGCDVDQPRIRAFHISHGFWLEPGLPLLGEALSPAQTRIHTESALTFTTYIRRFTQCLTTLAAAGTSHAR